MKVYNDALVRSRVHKVIARSEVPVSIHFVAYNCKICWQTARAALFTLALEGEIAAKKTTAGWVFLINREKGPGDFGSRRPAHIERPTPRRVGRVTDP